MDIHELIDRVITNRGLVGMEALPCVILTQGKRCPEVTLDASLRDLEVALLWREENNPADELVLEGEILTLENLTTLRVKVEGVENQLSCEAASYARTKALTDLARLRNAIDNLGQSIARHPDKRLRSKILEPFILKARATTTAIGWTDLSRPIYSVLEKVGSRRLSQVASDNKIEALKAAIASVSSRVARSDWDKKPNAEAAIQKMNQALDDYKPLHGAQGSSLGVVSFGLVADPKELDTFYRVMCSAWAQYIAIEARAQGFKLEPHEGGVKITSPDGEVQTIQMELAWDQILDF